MTHKYDDGEFEDILWKILVHKVFILDEINISDDERARDWADRFIKFVLKPIEDGTIPSPDSEYLDNLDCNTPYEVIKEAIPQWPSYDSRFDKPGDNEIIQKALKIVDEEYGSERKDLPDFFDASSDRWFWDHNLQQWSLRDEHDVFEEPTEENPSYQIQITCFECGHIKQLELEDNGENVGYADYRVPSSAEDDWECEKCGANNDFSNPAISDDTTFTKPVHNESLEKRFATNDLVERDFTGQDLRNVDFRNKNCSGAIFIKADLTGADFEGAKLREADFQEANIRKVNFTNAILDGAIFINANLFRTYFRYASLVKTDFLFASMVRLNFEGADLRNATINGAYLADVSFTGANLLNTDMFRLWDVDISDEQYEDFKKRGAKI